MSTILARRLKGSKARPVLVQEQYTPEALSVDLWALKADHVATKEQAWLKCDCGCQDSVASTSSTSSLSSSPSSPSSDEADSMFCVTPDHEHPPPTPSTSCSSTSSSMCEDTEEFWTEHAYTIEEASRSQPFEQPRRESARRPRSSRSSRPTSAASASQSRTSATMSLTSSASSYRPSARSSRRKQVPSSSPPYSSSSSEDDEELHFVRTARPRRSKRLNAYDCGCDDASQDFGCPPSPRPQSIQLRPVIETRLRTSVNPQFYLIYSLENVMMQERKIRYPLKDRATYTSFAICKGISLGSPLSRQVSVA